MAKKGGGKKGKKAPKVFDPLPGRELLRPALTYSEDNTTVPLVNGPKYEPYSTDSFQPPPEDGDSQVGVDDDGSLHDAVPPDFKFSFEDDPDIDEWHALAAVEENSDDAPSLSSYTDVEEDAPKVEEELGDESGITESEQSGSDLEGYDVPDLTSIDWSDDSKSCRSEPWSEEISSDEGDATEAANTEPPKVVKNKTKPVVITPAEKSAKKFQEPITKAKAEWITRKFADLFTSKSQSKLPIYTTVEDLLETNINFASIRPEVLEKLRKVAETPPVTRTPFQRPGDFERPSSSSSQESDRKKAEATAKVAAAAKPPPNDGKKTRGTPAAAEKNQKAKTRAKEPPPPPPKIIRRYPAELYEEDRRTTALKKPWIKKEELLATKNEQDYWVSESCEDINFIEYRRERILSGKKAPIGKKDFELDLIAGRMAKKLLAYEAAVNKELPDAEWDVREQPIKAAFELPPKPLIPIHVNPDEDPDDENTTSEEDEPKGGKEGSKSKATRNVDPCQIKPPVEEDDKYDYYNSDRSSSDCESVSNVIEKEIREKIRRQNPGAMLEIAGHPYNPGLPFKKQDIKTLPVDDLYALAHDLQMPPGELRKELQRPGEEMDYEPDDDDDGWQFVRGTFLYEKTPDFYAVQIKDLEQQIRLKREQWILLELEYNEFSVRNRVEFAALEEFIVYLQEKRRKEKEKVADLQAKLGKLKDQAWKATEYQNWWTNYLEEQKTKMNDHYEADRETLTTQLFTWREYVEKQRQMEATLDSLRRQAKNAKAHYTAKVSHMLLTSARKKHQLFHDYERRINIVFKEYQRALVLSMNDNLQEACRDHVAGRRAAKSFSDRAVTAIEAFKKASDNLGVAQERVHMRQELLALSTKHGDEADQQHVKLQAVQEYETLKFSRRNECQRGEHQAVANTSEAERLNTKNIHMDKLIASLRQEQEKLLAHLTAEQSINRQMESHLGKLVATISDYLAYLKAGTSNDNPDVKLCQLESFEDRFIRYLHYAAEIEGITGNKKHRKRPFLAEGDLGFVPKPHRKH